MRNEATSINTQCFQEHSLDLCMKRHQKKCDWHLINDSNWLCAAENIETLPLLNYNYSIIHIPSNFQSELKVSISYSFNHV